MRLAVFTSKYPGQTVTFFERDMRSLLDAGIAIEVFAIHPLDESLWRYATDLTDDPRVTRRRVQHLGMIESMRRGWPTLKSRTRTCLRDAGAVTAAAARFGPVPLAKTAYVLPKAWTWAREAAGRFDHVLAYWGNYAGTCAWAFHRLLGEDIPFSIWLHAGVDLYRTRVYLRQKLRYADNVFTCCEFNRDFIRAHYGDDGRIPPIHVCHHGLDLAGFPYQPLGRPSHRVIAVGRLAAHKGFDYLLWAAHILHVRGVQLTVELVGDGPERDALARQARDLGIADRVTFRGWLPFPEARRAMSEATVLVHPSDGLGDGLPNVVREAMALGTPVIGSDVAGLPDALGGGCGRLVRPRDSVALADAIESVLADEAGRVMMATRARSRVEERYDLQRNGARLAGLLRDTRRRPAAPVNPEPHWNPQPLIPEAR